MRPYRQFAYVAIAVAILHGTAQAEESLLQNGDFKAWKNGLPAGWVASQGARRGDVTPATVANRFEAITGGGVASVTTSDARHWKLLSRRFAAKPNTTYRIDFEARARGLRREPHQFANRWIGAFFRDRHGRRIGFQVVELHAQAWQKDFLHVRAPVGTAYGETAFFCSLSGRFEVRSMAVTAVTDPAASFDLLVADMDRYYPFFAQHGIDWKALAAKHRARALAAEGTQAFADAITPLLAALADGHVWVDAPERRVPHTASVKLNFELPQVLARLATWKQVMRNIIAGRTKDGYGYLAVGTMQGNGPDRNTIDAAWRGLFDAPAIVLDLRANAGGAEAWGQHWLGCLTDKPVHYGTSKLRAGPSHEAFHAGSRRYVQPRPVRYKGTVVALVGPGCVSSGEAMALMCRALPGVTLVGLPTRGSSGAPAPLHLPNQVIVWYSRWISLLPDGTGFERTGVAPDVRVEHRPGADPAFDRAIQLIKARLRD